MLRLFGFCLCIFVFLKLIKSEFTSSDLYLYKQTNIDCIICDQQLFFYENRDKCINLIVYMVGQINKTKNLYKTILSQLF